METDDPEFTYTNLTGRLPGPMWRALSAVMPGVAAVQQQLEPYAEAWRSHNLEALRGTGPRWVALGDSMTQGIGASAPFRGWVGQLAEELDEPVDVVNLSQTGARVDDVLTLQLPAWRSLPRAPAGEILTLLVGSNDMMNLRYRGVLVDAFSELLTALPDGAVVATVPSFARPAEQVNEMIDHEGRTGRIRVVRAGSSEPGDWQGKLAADHFHPNDTGYAVIAAQFAPQVRAALAALPEPPERDQRPGGGASPS